MFRDTALLLFCFSSLVSAQSASGSLSVYVANAGAASAQVAATLRAELRDILSGSGIQVQWHDGDGSVGGRLVVMRLQGSCRGEIPPTPNTKNMKVTQDPEALGSTHVSNGEVLPFADIHCDRIRSFVAAPLSIYGSAVVRDEMFGRAVARVMAHELYHILLKTTSHGKKGLARASQTAGQLIAPRTTFAHDDERKLSAEAAGSTGYVADDGAER
jgi:hypothetical protein